MIEAHPHRDAVVAAARPGGGRRSSLFQLPCRYGPKKRCWYKLHEVHEHRTGRQFISGTFGYWGLIESMKIERDLSGIGPGRARAAQPRRSRGPRSGAEKRAERARFAARAPRSNGTRRACGAETRAALPLPRQEGRRARQGLRFSRRRHAVVPMLRYDVTDEQDKPIRLAGPRRLVGLQKIAPDGSKRFNKGMWKEGAMCRLGKKPKDGELVLVAEGVATALSRARRSSASTPVFVAFDCYNLKPAAKILRALYPSSPILFFADDDLRHRGQSRRRRWRRRRRLRSARRASFCLRSARSSAGPRTPTSTTARPFRDRGLRTPVRAAAETPRWRPEDAGECCGPGGAGGGKGGGEPDWDLHDALLERFTLVYPSDTAFDDRDRQAREGRAHAPHVRQEADRSVARLGAQARRVAESVLFDPSEACDPVHDGESLPRHQDEALGGGLVRQADRAAALSLRRGRRSEHADLDWVLKWAAYPLQHVGAKMQTAVVMYGEEGTGKNLFWGAVRAIYGDHAGVITQMQLQGQFNTWLSAKLFLIANEVVTRHEMRHHVGYLKNLITEPEIYINRKMVDERREENHANMVFLSNELQPLQINPRDRRYMVIRTPGAREEEFYKAVGAEIRAGGAGALYRYLLDLELGDFNEHAKPLETQAKRELIELGMPASQLFWQDLHDNVLGLPYVPALATDLYKAYQVWCVRNGEKMPERINRFLPSFMSLNGVRRVDARVPDPDRPLEVADRAGGATQASRADHGRVAA
jgi:putative DNA primase/helicase